MRCSIVPPERYLTLPLRNHNLKAKIQDIYNRCCNVFQIRLIRLSGILTCSG